jgi:hypothetical protein
MDKVKCKEIKDWFPINVGGVVGFEEDIPQEELELINKNPDSSTPYECSKCSKPISFMRNQYFVGDRRACDFCDKDLIDSYKNRNF